MIVKAEVARSSAMIGSTPSVRPKRIYEGGDHIP